jgi:hypothetical protein
MNAYDMPVATDGLNEKGLGFGALYLPGEAKYQYVKPGEEAKALSNAAFGAWVLGNFETVDEVKAAVGDVVVWGETVPQLGSFAPLHYSVHDASGKSVVIEYADGKLNVYDNEIGVLTNSPTYEWHIQNLRNYVNLTAENAKPVKVGNVTYVGTGQGSGLHGLPGDPTPPSRFVMAAATAYLADKPKDAAEALIVAQHLINRVDIPKGLVRDYSEGGKPAADYTQWTTFRDHADLQRPGDEGGRPEDVGFQRRTADALAQHCGRQADGADGITGAVLDRHAVRLAAAIGRLGKSRPCGPDRLWRSSVCLYIPNRCRRPCAAAAIREAGGRHARTCKGRLARCGSDRRDCGGEAGFRSDQMPGRQSAHPGQLDGDALLPGCALG